MDLGRARKILNVADSAFISMDDEGRITCWNIRAEEAFGWTREPARRTTPRCSRCAEPQMGSATRRPDRAPSRR
jgi:PAS domain S-box-containing protein